MKTAICLDLDGTVTKEELLPKIASLLEIETEIEALTRATIQGLIPFESSFKLRVQLLKQLPITQVQHLLKSAQLYNNICQLIKQYPKNFYIITGNLDVWVQGLLHTIGAKSFSSTAKVVRGQIQGISKILNKADAIRELRKEFQRIVAVGEGMNDVPMFEVSDVSIAFGATHPPVKTALEICDLVINDEDALCRILKTLL